MVIKFMGLPFYVIFAAKDKKQFNELNNFAKTHNLHLIEDGEDGYYTIDDENYTPNKKDITRFLKVLKDSGDWDANSSPGDQLSPAFLVISYIDQPENPLLN